MKKKNLRQSINEIMEQDNQQSSTHHRSGDAGSRSLLPRKARDEDKQSRWRHEGRRDEQDIESRIKKAQPGAADKW